MVLDRRRGGLLPYVGLKRPMHATKQPSYSEGDYGAGIGLCFDRAAQYFLETTRSIRRLSINVLDSPGRLIG